MLKEKLINKQSGILLYGITPTRSDYLFLKMKEISEKRIDRIKKLPVDGLVIYDIQDEKTRNKEKRPFPFSPVLNPIDYAELFLKELDLEKIIYQSVGHYNISDFKFFLDRIEKNNYLTVFVGSPSRDFKLNLKLNVAYSYRKSLFYKTFLGGIVIPERHNIKKNEHLNILNKINFGCSFFITQCVYNLEFAKNMLSDYYFSEGRKDFAPIIFTLTACGSLETLSFMKWLGINIPGWLENELKYSQDILSRSASLLLNIAREITSFCIDKKIPFGFNVESVSIRKAEINASVDLVFEIDKMLKEYGVR